MQAQLKSDHQSSSLSLGAITRIEDNAGRKDPRGEGFELRTDAHGVLRAQDGMLITTEGRPDAARHAKDMGETIQCLTSARDQIEGLAEAARTAEAQDGNDDQSTVAHAIKQQNEDLRGHGSPSTEGRFPELATPHLALASPAGIAATTATHLHAHTGAHIQLTSAGHTSLSAAQRILASVAEGMRIFTLKSGIKAFASQGDIRIEAQSDAIEATALKDIDIVSTEDTVYITAKKKVTINGGTSFSEWSEGGIRHGTLLAQDQFQLAALAEVPRLEAQWHADVAFLGQAAHRVQVVKCHRQPRLFVEAFALDLIVGMTPIGLHLPDLARRGIERGPRGRAAGPGAEFAVQVLVADGPAATGDDQRRHGVRLDCLRVVDARVLGFSHLDAPAIRRIDVTGVPTELVDARAMAMARQMPIHLGAAGAGLCLIHRLNVLGQVGGLVFFAGAFACIAAVGRRGLEHAEHERPVVLVASLHACADAVGHLVSLVVAAGHDDGHPPDLQQGPVSRQQLDGHSIAGALGRTHGSVSPP
ncbi:DUF2345 domain-containing protein [Variovorax boronicumulans]|uniref:DUF2345 domain-containing protein n=1 Tax=Variovorax boronicumulans TaxID=436515 RepID=UPI003520D849